MKKFIYLLITALLAVNLAACSNNSQPTGTSNPEEEVNAELEDNDKGGETVTVTHQMGTTEVAVNPEKVIVFDLGILDIFKTLDIPVGGLPKTANLPAYLDIYTGDEYINAGGMKETNNEEIYAYAPDLIIISGRVGDSYDELSEIAPTIYISNPGATYMESLKENLDILAQVYPDKAEEFEGLYNDLTDEAAQLREDVKSLGLNALTLMVNDGSVSVFGAGSRYGIIHDTFGFIAAADNVEDTTHGQEGSFEYIRDVNPDVIFVIDRSAAIGTEGATGAQTLLDNDLVNETIAAQNDKIIYLSSDIWYLASGGFEATKVMIEDVRNALRQ